MRPVIARSLLVAGCTCILASTPAGAADLGVADLAHHLASPRPEERLAAFTGLGQLRTPAAAKAAITGARLHARLTSIEIEALAQTFGGQDIAQSVALLQAPESFLVEAAVLDLGRRPPEAVLLVVKDLLARSDTTAIAQRILGVALRQNGKTPAHEALALVRFQDPNEQRRLEAVWALRGVASLTQATAMHIASDAAASVRMALVEILVEQVRREAGLAPEAAPWGRQLLCRLASDASGMVRAKAFDRLNDCWQIRPAGSSAKPEQELFLAALSDPDPSVRYQAIIHFRVTSDTGAQAHLERLAGDPEGIVASVALDVLRGLGSPNLAQLAVKACSLPHPQNRRVGLQILLELKDPHLAQVATRLLDDPDYQVRSEAQQALGQGEVGVEAGALALAQGAQLKPSERQALLVRLTRMDPSARQEELTKLYQGMTPDQRRKMLAVFARDGRLAASASGFLLALVVDPNPVIASAAFEGLRRGNETGFHIGVAEALGQVDNRDPAVARAARGCVLTALSAPEPLDFTSLFPEIDDDAEVRPSPATDVAALCAAAVVAPAAEKADRFQILAGLDDERALQTLRESARSKDRATRWAALDALVRLGDQSDTTLDHGLARLLTARAEDRESRLIWPAMTPKLLERLQTFAGVADEKAIAHVRADIERRLAALASKESLR